MHLLLPFQMPFFIQLCSSWQDFNWYSMSRGHSVIAEPLVYMCQMTSRDHCVGWLITESLRDVAMATDFETILAANGLWREIMTWGFHTKDGLFSISPYVCWSLCLDSYLRQSELLHAGDCQVGNWHINRQHCNFFIGLQYESLQKLKYLGTWKYSTCRMWDTDTKMQEVLENTAWLATLTSLHLVA